MSNKPTMEERFAALEGRLATSEKINADQQKTIEALKAPKGIRSAKANQKPDPIPWTTEERAELELRRYIKKAGHYPCDKGKKIKEGFYKNLSQKKKDRATFLLKEVLHRTKMVWDETILDFQNHQPVGDQTQ